MIGFENTSTVKLINTSLVDMEFILRIPHDEDTLFTVTPSRGSVAAQSTQTVKVIFS